MNYQVKDWETTPIRLPHNDGATKVVKGSIDPPKYLKKNNNNKLIIIKEKVKKYLVGILRC